MAHKRDSSLIIPLKWYSNSMQSSLVAGQTLQFKVAFLLEQSLFPLSGLSFSYYFHFVILLLDSLKCCGMCFLSHLLPKQTSTLTPVWSGCHSGLTGTGLVFSWYQPRSETCCRGPGEGPSTAARCQSVTSYFTGFRTELDRSRGSRVRSKKGNACQDAKLPRWLPAASHLRPLLRAHTLPLTFAASQGTSPRRPCPREECCSHRSPKPALPQPDPARGIRHTCGSFGHAQLTSTLHGGECRAGVPWRARPGLPCSPYPLCSHPWCSSNAPVNDCLRLQTWRYIS